MRSISISFIILLLSVSVHGNNLEISSTSWNGSTSVISFDISWENSWMDASGDFHDAVWVFVKYAPNGGTQWSHADIATASPVPAAVTVFSPSDSKGSFIKRSGVGSGDLGPVTMNFQVTGSVGLYPEFKVFGIEMVYVPEGPFYLGGDMTGPGVHFHEGSLTSVPFYVNTNGALPYGTSTGEWSTTAASGYTTDIPAYYPNGYDQFYAMKYPVTAEQFVAFLNTLTFDQQNYLTKSDLTALTPSNIYVMSLSSNPVSRCGIKADTTGMAGFPVTFFCDLNNNGIPNEIDDGQNIVMPFASYLISNAYADWAALRPLSLLEYEKMCRGPLLGVKDERAWGTAAVQVVSPSIPFTNPGRPDESHPQVGDSALYFDIACRVGIAATDSSNRSIAGAGFYGHMHLSSYAEDICVDAEDFGPGNSFSGIPGNGSISSIGLWDNPDWPSVVSDYCSKGGNYPMIQINTVTDTLLLGFDRRSIRVAR